MAWENEQENRVCFQKYRRNDNGQLVNSIIIPYFSLVLSPDIRDIHMLVKSWGHMGHKQIRECFQHDFVWNKLNNKNIR